LPFLKEVSNEVSKRERKGLRKEGRKEGREGVRVEGRNLAVISLPSKC
jgi:hypothetical protein